MMEWVEKRNTGKKPLWYAKGINKIGAFFTARARGKTGAAEKVMANRESMGIYDDKDIEVREFNPEGEEIGRQVYVWDDCILRKKKV